MSPRLFAERHLAHLIIFISITQQRIRCIFQPIKGFFTDREMKQMLNHFLNLSGCFWKAPLNW